MTCPRCNYDSCLCFLMRAPPPSITRIDHRAQLIRALTDQAWGTMASMLGCTVDGDLIVAPVCVFAFIRVAALPTPEQLAAAILGET